MKKANMLTLANGLTIPVSVGTMKISLMGGNGSGKSYAAIKFIEEYVKAGPGLVRTSDNLF